MSDARDLTADELVDMAERLELEVVARESSTAVQPLIEASDALRAAASAVLYADFIRAHKAAKGKL
jgi:hypothetical protein